MSVKFAAVHTLNKVQHSNTASCNYSEELATINDSTERLINAIYDKYANKSAKGYGKFEEDHTNYPMGMLIPDYFSKLNTLNDDTQSQNSLFYTLSINIIDHLKARAETESASTGGHVLISHMIVDDNEHIIIAIITDTIGSAIRNGQILDSVHVDLNSLKMVGKINVTSMHNLTEELYISFLKGSVNIADYFKRFLGCNDTINDKDETRKLVKHLKIFCENYDEETKNNFLTMASSYLNDLANTQSPLDIVSLSNHLCSESPEELIAHLSDEELQISNHFIPNRETIKGLIKFKISTRQWSVSFDRSVIGNDVVYSSDENTITLFNVPDDLRQELISTNEE